LPAQQQLKLTAASSSASSSTIKDAMAGMMSLAEGLFPQSKTASKHGSGSRRDISTTPNRSPSGLVRAVARPCCVWCVVVGGGGGA
jgi:hypothetical protein